MVKTSSIHLKKTHSFRSRKVFKGLEKVFLLHNFVKTNEKVQLNEIPNCL